MLPGFTTRLKVKLLSPFSSRHLFHKSCVDPWLLDHRTCPMCKMNILKALGIAVSPTAPMTLRFHVRTTDQRTIVSWFLSLQLNADCLDDLPLDYDLALGGGVGMGGVGALEAVASGASSDGTLSEGGSSVVLDPGVRRVGLPQDYQDPDLLRDSPVTATTDTHTGWTQTLLGTSQHARRWGYTDTWWRFGALHIQLPYD